MRIKHHPAVIIDIKPDGRIEMFFAEPLRHLDRIKIRLIESTIRNRKEHLAKRFSSGNYRVYMTHYSLVKQKTKFALKPM